MELLDGSVVHRVIGSIAVDNMPFCFLIIYSFIVLRNQNYNKNVCEKNSKKWVRMEYSLIQKVELLKIFILWEG